MHIERYRQNKIIYKIVLFFILAIIVFYAKNLSRINKEIIKYQYEPLYSPYYIVSEDYYTSQNIDQLISNFINCEQKNLNCLADLSPKVGLLYKKYIFFR